MTTFQFVFISFLILSTGHMIRMQRAAQLFPHAPWLGRSTACLVSALADVVLAAILAGLAAWANS